MAGELICMAGELAGLFDGDAQAGQGKGQVPTLAHNTRHDAHTFALHPECDRPIGRLRDVENVVWLFGHRLGAAAERREFFEQARARLLLLKKL
jgi:hypothetical protein